MIWAYINLFIAVIAVKGAFNKCLVSASVVLCFFIIGLFQFFDLVPLGLYSFAFGSMVYALPCIAAFNSKFTRKNGVIALSLCLLMLLELLAAYLWLIDFYAIVGSFYRPVALALYSLVVVACFRGSNGRLHKRDGSYFNRHKYNMDHGQIDRMGFKRARR